MIMKKQAIQIFQCLTVFMALFGCITQPCNAETQNQSNTFPRPDYYFNGNIHAATNILSPSAVINGATVNIVSPTHNQILGYAGSTGTIKNITLELDNISDVNVPTPVDNYVLTWVAAENIWKPSPAAAGAGGGSYNDENAQDAVGGILQDSSTIDFTYNDTTPSITASFINTPGYLASESDPKVGSLTNNYLPKWNGSTELENSIVYADAANVGIDTDNPVHKFHVTGDIFASGNLIASITQVGLATANYVAKGDGSSLTTNNSSIYDNENVGIGTTSPERDLTISSSDNTVQMMLKNTGTGGREWSLFSTNDNSGLGGGKFVVYDDTSGGQRLTITNTGNVGIGTTSPGAALEISESDSGNLNLLYITNENVGELATVNNNFLLTGTDSVMSGGGVIRVGKEQEWTGTASTRDSYMSFLTRLDNLITEQVRISSDGNLTIEGTFIGDGSTLTDLPAEIVQDYAWLNTIGTTSGIDVTYQDSTNDVDFDVTLDLEGVLINGNDAQANGITGLLTLTGESGSDFTVYSNAGGNIVLDSYSVGAGGTLIYGGQFSVFDQDQTRPIFDSDGEQTNIRGYGQTNNEVIRLLVGSSNIHYNEPLTISKDQIIMSTPVVIADADIGILDVTDTFTVSGAVGSNIDMASNNVDNVNELTSNYIDAASIDTPLIRMFNFGFGEWPYGYRGANFLQNAEVGTGGSQYGIHCFTEFNGNLIVGMRTDPEDDEDNLWQYDGTTWSVFHNFHNESDGDDSGASPGYHDLVSSLEVHSDGLLYAGLGTNTSRGDVYVYSGGTWSLSLDTDSTEIYALKSFQGNLYAAPVDSATIYSWNGSVWSDAFILSPTYTTVESDFENINDTTMYIAVDGVASEYDILQYDGSNWSIFEDFSDIEPAGFTNRSYFTNESDVYLHYLVDGKLYQFFLNTSNRIENEEFLGSAASGAIYFDDETDKLYVIPHGNIVQSEGETFGFSSIRRWSVEIPGSQWLAQFTAITKYGGEIFVGGKGFTANNVTGLYYRDIRRDYLYSNQTVFSGDMAIPSYPDDQTHLLRVNTDLGKLQFWLNDDWVTVDP